MGDQGRRRVDVGLGVQLPGRNDLLMVSFRALRTHRTPVCELGVNGRWTKAEFSGRVKNVNEILEATMRDHRRVIVGQESWNKKNAYIPPLCLHQTRDASVKLLFALVLLTAAQSFSAIRV